MANGKNGQKRYKVEWNTFLGQTGKGRLGKMMGVYHKDTQQV